MSDREHSGRRDLLYSHWHRPAQIRRYLKPVDAAKLEMIDLDSIESCPVCHTTLAMTELKNSANDPRSFPSHITADLAIDADKPAFVVCYTCVCGVTGSKHETRDGCDIAEFRVQQIAPQSGGMWEMSPDEYANWLLAFRRLHFRRGCSAVDTSERTA
jgi:hypothetical protein